MADLLPTNVKVIPSRSPEFEGERFDFETLRRIGMDHVGRFSGKIWTDHNLHDPGITILEVLCYALIDLGFRTKLPLADLLASKNSGQPDDQFFTPAEILSNNPLTILDYRKLLMDIEGVRNAWLLPVEDCLLTTVQAPAIPSGSTMRPIYLQGIYQICIEPEEILPELPKHFNIKRPKNQQTDPKTDCCSEEICQNTFFQDCGNWQIFEVKTPSGAVEKWEKWVWTNEEAAKRKYLLHQIEQVLHQHRNLCEDFEEPKILCQEKIQLCADIEIEPDAQPEKIWVEIMRRLRQFFSPDIRHYYLQELLDKGLPIEEIFEGRPLSRRSAGFIDTAEIAARRLPKEFHHSDLYKILAEIPGIVAIGNLKLTGILPDGTKHNQTCTWKYQLAPGHFPTADLQNSCINFSRNQLNLPAITPLRKQALIQAYLPPQQKAVVSTAPLPAPTLLPGDLPRPTYARFDIELPTGNYRSDLGEYFSIQNEFPIVYGIGEGHLALLDTPDEKLTDEQKIRKAQALQLKGYLLFFDQLLANYAAQLANLRHLFSMSPDDERPPEAQHTMFTQNLASVPMVERLIRFYKGENSPAAPHADGDPLAIPALDGRIEAIRDWLAADSEGVFELEVDYCEFEKDTAANPVPDPACGSTTPKYTLKQGAFTALFARNVYIETWLRDFRDGTYRVEFLQDSLGAYFVIISQDETQWLISRRRYPTAQLAREAADLAIVLGTLPDAFRQIDGNAPSDYSFELVFRDADYLVFLQDLLEKPEQYCARRQQFLDHLLAHFCERFSDFAALSYDALHLESTAANIRHKNDKARYLQNFDDLSRDRAKAFNYQKLSWETANVSGLEAKIAAQIGIRNFRREGLCSMEKVDCDKARNFYFQIRDENGMLLFRSEPIYETRDAAQQAFKDFSDALAQPANYDVQRDHFGKEFIRVGKLQFLGNLAEAKKTASEQIAALTNLFNPQNNAANTFVSRHEYRLNLKNSEGKLVQQGKKQWQSRSEAESNRSFFLEKEAPATAKWLARPDAPDTFFDISGIRPATPKLPTRFFWQIQNADGSTRRSAETWFDASEVPAKFALEIEQGRAADFNFIEKKNTAWQLQLRAAGKKGNLLAGAFRYASEQHARLAARTWRNAATSQRAAENLAIQKLADGKFQIQLRSDAGRLLAVSEAVADEKNLEKQVQTCRDLLSKKDMKLATEKLAGDFYGFHFRGTAEQKPAKKLDKKLDKKPEQVSFLQSIQLFSTAAEALDALEKIPATATKTSDFVPTGDAANPDYGYLLKTSDPAEFAGFLPEILDDEAERNTRLKNAAAYFSNWKNPVAVLPEPDLFQFEWENLLVAAAPAGSPDAAAADFEKAFARVANLKNYRFDAARKSVVLADERDEILAVFDSKIDSKIDQPMAAWQAVLKKLEPQRHLVLSEAVAVEWEFKVTSGIKTESEGALVFESKNAFSSQQTAELAHADFLKNMKTARPVAVEMDGKQQISVQSGSLSLLSQDLKTAAERERNLSALAKWLPWSASIRDLVGGSFSAFSAASVQQQPPPKPGNPDQPCDTGECYEIVKTDQPLAVHPCTNWQEVAPADGGCAEIYNRFSAKKYTGNLAELQRERELICNATPPCLDLCLDGLDTTLEVVDKFCVKTWRFALRLRQSFEFCGRKIPAGTVLWQSAETFGTAAEAEAAFQKNYLQVLQWASVAANYGSEDGACIRFRAKLEDFPEEKPTPAPTDPCGCQPCKKAVGIGIEVPFAKVQADVFYAMSNDQMAHLLAEAARTYPIILVKNELEQCGCACPADPTCPCPEPPAPAKPCQTGQIAPQPKYKFRLYQPDCDAKKRDCKDLNSNPFSAADLAGRVIWESERCYDSPQAARADLEIFAILLAKKTVNNCRFVPHCCDQPNRWSLAIVETLLLPIHTGDQPTALANDINALYQALKSPDAFRLIYNPKGTADRSEKDGSSDKPGCFFFQVVREDFHFAKSPSVFENEAQANFLIQKSLIPSVNLLTKLDANVVFDSFFFVKNHPALDSGKEFYFLAAEVPKAEGCFKIQLNSRGASGIEQVLLQTSKTTCLDPFLSATEQREKLKPTLLKFHELLKNRDNWRVEGKEVECSPMYFELIDEQQVIAQNPICYATQTAARAAIERAKACLFKENFHLVEHLLLRPSKPATDPNGNPTELPDECNFPLPKPLDCSLEFYPKPDEDCPTDPEAEYYVPLADPYSMWATVVLPCYTPRFCRADFRQFFERLLRCEAPAHIALCFRWLCPADVCQFETLFSAWLRAKSGCSTDDAEAARTRCELIKFLKTVKDCPIEIPAEPDKNCDCTPPQTNPDCGCGKKKKEQKPDGGLQTDFVQLAFFNPDQEEPKDKAVPICQWLFSDGVRFPERGVVVQQPTKFEPVQWPTPSGVATPAAATIEVATTEEIENVAAAAEAVAMKKSALPQPTAKTSKKKAAAPSTKTQKHESTKTPEANLHAHLARPREIIEALADPTKIEQPDFRWKNVFANWKKASRDPQLADSEAFQYAQHFVKNNGSSRTLAGFVQKIVAAAGKKLTADWRLVLLCGTVRCLDKTALENPQGLFDEQKTELQTALQLLKKAKIERQELLDFWQPEILEKSELVDLLTGWLVD